MTEAGSRLLTAARLYTTLGWAVFPLRPRRKEPLTPRGVLDASKENGQINQALEKLWAMATTTSGHEPSVTTSFEAA